MEKDNVIKTITESIKNLEDKKFNLLFFVVDSKGTPLGSLAYIYELAKRFNDAGYNVKMLHAEKEFIGVKDWMGEEYASLPHFYTDKDAVSVAPEDFLFIPEIYSSVMTSTKNFPCKRIAILQNFNYLTDTIPMGVSWDDLKIHDCITTSEALKARVEEAFPGTNTIVVPPIIANFFNEDGTEARKLIINVVSKNKSEIDSIIKPFYWKYPQYKWVAFRNVYGLPRKEFADALKEGFATLWCDNSTNFGFSALEAMACGSLVIGKIPESEPEWLAGESIRNNGLWFYKNADAQEAISTAIQSFITNTIPEEVYEEMRKTVEQYREKGDYLTEIEKMFDRRKDEFEKFLQIFKEKDNVEKGENDNENK